MPPPTSHGSPRPSGTVVPVLGGRELSLTRALPHPVEVVWRALTAPERLARWFGDWTGDPATGVVLLTTTGEPGTEPEPVPVSIEVCAPPTDLVVEVADDALGTPWHLDLTLRAAAGSTVLTLRQPLDPGVPAGIVGPGWELYLDRLAAHLAGVTLPEWDDDYAALADHYWWADERAAP